MKHLFLMTRIKIYLTLVIITAIFIFIGPAYLTKEKVTLTVNKTERITKEENGKITSKYMVYTDNEVFENVDTWLYFKFNSSDLYGLMLPNKKYEAEVYGFRIPFLSKYRNIISIKELKN